MTNFTAFTLCISIWCITGCGRCQTSTSAASLQSTCSTGSAELGISGNISDLHAYDDLEWLVGRWWCIEKSWLDQAEHLEGSHDERLVEWFNVFLPYADENLTLKVTGTPEDRRIAAEFVIRADPNDYYASKGLAPMSPRSVVCISTNVIRIGDPLHPFDLNYRRIKDSKKPRIEMKSKHMRLVFEKMCDIPGDVRESWALAPITDCSSEELEILSLRYRELKKQLR